jgi:FlaG/FlaF family flagellin (archaellin)
MMQGFDRRHAIKLAVMLVLLVAISVMLTATPERYVYGGF